MTDQRRNLAVVQTPSNPTDEMAVWQMIERQADVLVKSGMLPESVKTPAAAVAIMVLGRELGFERMQSFRLIDVIKGKPTLNAGGMAAIVQNYCKHHGGYLRVVESTAEQATVEFKRADWPAPHRLSFSMEDAKRAGLPGKNPTWNQYPQNMCYARAIANACRMGFPEVVAGIYDPDELGGTTAHASITSAPDVPGSQSAFDGSHDADVIDAIGGPSSESRAMRRLHAVGKDRGLDHDNLRAAAIFHHADAKSLKDLTETQLDELASRIETHADLDLATWTTPWSQLIAEAANQAELDEIGVRMGGAGISSKTHYHLAAEWQDRKAALTRSAAAPAPWEVIDDESPELPGMPADQSRRTA